MPLRISMTSWVCPELSFSKRYFFTTRISSGTMLSTVMMSPLFSMMNFMVCSSMVHGNIYPSFVVSGSCDWPGLSSLLNTFPGIRTIGPASGSLCRMLLIMSSRMSMLISLVVGCVTWFCSRVVLLAQ